MASNFEALKAKSDMERAQMSFASKQPPKKKRKSRVSWGWSGTAVLAQLSTAWSAHSDSLLSGLVLGHFCRFLWGHFGILVWEQPCILAWKLVLVHSDIAVLE